MRKSHAILSVVFILVILGCATAAFVVWRHQKAAALVGADIPEIPDLSRWPKEFSRQVQDATAKARSGPDRAGSLARLAGLYLGNSYVAQSKAPLAALCRLEPSNAKWRYLLGDARARLGETNAAEADFQKTAALDPKYAMASIRLGLLRTKRGAVAEAHDCYAKAAAADPDNLMPAFLLLEFEARNGGDADVRRRVEDFSQVHPGFKDPHELLAVIESAAGDAAAAAKENRLALAAPQQLPNEDPWIDGLAEFCFDADRLRELALEAFGQGRIETAEGWLKRAIQIAPADPTLRDALYSVYEKKGRLADALGALQEGVKECPDDPNLRVQLSRLLCSMHRPDDAVAAIQSAAQRWPANAKVRAALGYALSSAGKNAQAAAELQEAIRIDFTLVDERYNLAVCLLALGRRDAAREAAQKALDMRPDYADAMALLGLLALEDGNLAAAELPVSRLYAAQPDDPKARTLLCGLQLLKGSEAERAGKIVDAEESYRAGLAVDTNYWRLLRAEGLLDLRQGRFPEAVGNLRGYACAQPEKTEAYFVLGVALKKAGQADEARKTLEQGLALEQQGASNPREIAAFKQALGQP